VTGTATIGKACPKCIIDINALVAVELCAALSFRSDKFALEKLPSATHRAKWVALDDAHGRIGHRFEAASLPDLLDKGLVNAFIRRVGHAVFVNQLRIAAGSYQRHERTNRRLRNSYHEIPQFLVTVHPSVLQRCCLEASDACAVAARLTIRIIPAISLGPKWRPPSWQSIRLDRIFRMRIMFLLGSIKGIPGLLSALRAAKFRFCSYGVKQNSAKTFRGRSAKAVLP
jgi:hypothetical protein